jgi:hypothetical protein
VFRKKEKKRRNETAEGFEFYNLGEIQCFSIYSAVSAQDLSYLHFFSKTIKDRKGFVKLN